MELSSKLPPPANGGDSGSGIRRRGPPGGRGGGGGHRRHHNNSNNRNNPHQHNNNNKRRRHNRGPPPPPPPQPSCCVCADAEKTPSYKCPTCRALYCSVVCCKEHKPLCPGKPPEENNNANNQMSTTQLNLEILRAAPSRRDQNQNQEDDDSEEDSLDDGWKLTEEMKTAVQESDWLRKELQDGGLRDLMTQIVASRNTEALSQVQQRFPHFQVFLDKVLVVAGILEREIDSADPIQESIEEWLERDWSQDPIPPQLSLKALLRKMPIFEPVDVSSSSEEEEEDDEASSSAEESSDDGNEEDESSSGEVEE